MHFALNKRISTNRLKTKPDKWTVVAFSCNCSYILNSHLVKLPFLKVMGNFLSLTAGTWVPS